MDAMWKRRVMVTTPKGRYEWDPVLQTIDFIPKKRRVALYTIFPDSTRNNEEGVMKKIGRDLAHGNYLDQTKSI